jgi:hypothetical protein
MRRPIIFGIFVVVLAASQGCGAGRAGSGVNASSGPLREFRQRIDTYMDLREDIVDEVGSAEVTRDVSVIRAREDALAQRIRAARGNAKHGDIFTPDVRVLFRRLMRPELKGEDGPDIRARLSDDAPAPGAVPVDVNAKYPAGVPVATMPAHLLGVLPVLPRELEYRFVGKDLILLDRPADVILDYIRNAIG